MSVDKRAPVRDPRKVWAQSLFSVKIALATTVPRQSQFPM